MFYKLKMLIGALFLVITIISTINGQSVVANICTGLGHGSLVRNIQDCNSYFTCFNGQPLLSTCLPNRHFNHITGVCDLPENVDCFECPTNKTLIDLHVPNECNQFVRCFRGEPEQLTCSDGLLFDRQYEMCNLQAQVNCPFEVSCPRSGLMFRRDRDECARFYICVNGDLTEGQCPQNLFFNTQTNMCDLAENTDCVQITEAPITERPEEPQEPEDPEGLFPQCPGRIGDGPYYPHPTDCTQYYHCIKIMDDNEEIIINHCNDGYFYDYKQMLCIFDNAEVCYNGEN